MLSAGTVDRALFSSGPILRAITDSAESAEELRDVIVCSLEPWDEVWRRNQFLVDALLARQPRLRILFVEPPADVLFDLSQRRVPTMPRARRLSPDGRLRAFRPLKPVPRRFGPLADESLLRQVQLARWLAGFERPVLWINDVTYAPLVARTEWPSVYDVTDDWLLAPLRPRELARLRRLDALAMRSVDEVVVCSQELAKSRGSVRPVSLIPNGVDMDHFRRPHPRPADLPSAPVALYAGSLHESRLDVELVVDVASVLPDVSFVLVGPNSLAPGSLASLRSLPNVTFLGPRPYADIPAYLQHADVIIVPHLVSPFTDSLDPIKAYECVAVGTPTVATPVAGFRDLASAIAVVDRRLFAAQVRLELHDREIRPPSDPPTWVERAVEFERLLISTQSKRALAG